MPTYEYKCKEESCSHKWEETQSIKESATTKCPKCKKETAQRLISGGVGFVLKGGGWFGSGGY